MSEPSIAEFETFEKILSKINQYDKLSAGEMEFLLELKDPRQKRTLYKKARDLRQEYFGGRVFFYGFLYLSTYCGNDCSFCFYRRSNSESIRYRKAKAEILEAARRLAGSGVHLIDLTLGEDPAYHCGGYDGFKKLVELVNEVWNLTNLPIMISAGVLPRSILIEMDKAGAAWYACYQETHNRSLFERLRLDQSYDRRMTSKFLAHEAGLLLEEGILCGVGETTLDLVESILTMGRMPVEQARVMGFVPQRGTPMQLCTGSDLDRELLTIALMRISFPDKLIPASLDVNGLAGLKKRLDAGANVITSFVPPDCGLAGVAQSSLDIDNANRTITGILPTLNSCCLVPASIGEYRALIDDRFNESRSGRFERRADSSNRR